jgi:hypothetical protein
VENVPPALHGIGRCCGKILELTRIQAGNGTSANWLARHRGWESTIGSSTHATVYFSW